MNKYVLSTVGRAISAAFVCALVAAAALGCDKDRECDDLSAWSEFTRVTLRSSSPDQDSASTLVASFDHAKNDLMVDVDHAGPGSSAKGTVAVVGGRIMLSKGLDLHPGYEVDALDGPILAMRLALGVLARMFPGGPEEIAGTMEFDKGDDIGIKFATPSASGYVPAPWNAKGKVSRLSADTLAFEFEMEYPGEGGKGGGKLVKMAMQGELGLLGRAVFEDGDTLDGWTVYGLGVQQSTQNGGTIIDYGAAPQKDAKFRTIGDIRGMIAEEEYPGLLDSTKDFTGFWKEQCDQAFGLQIMHQGGDGKYSVLFCGPGGCDDPSETRLTYITGDKNWEVISEDELVRIRRDGERDVYHRCTRETNPKLEYTK